MTSKSHNVPMQCNVLVYRYWWLKTATAVEAAKWVPATTSHPTWGGGGGHCVATAMSQSWIAKDAIGISIIVLFNVFIQRVMGLWTQIGTFSFLNVVGGSIRVKCYLRCYLTSMSWRKYVSPPATRSHNKFELMVDTWIFWPASVFSHW